MIKLQFATNGLVLSAGSGACCHAVRRHEWSRAGASRLMSSFIRASRPPAGPRTPSLRSRCERPAARHPGTRPCRAGARLALAAAAPALALAAAGCAGQASVPLPPKAAAVLRSPAQVADQVSPRQQVMAAYAGYWQASDAAVNAGSAGPARRILAPYVPATAIPDLIAALRQDWDTHSVIDGNPVLHIVSVKVRQRRATVHDCVDLSHAGLKNARTGAVLPHSFGNARANYYANLVLRGGRWLVSNIVPVVASCDS
jgi:hypothetical protein